MIFNKITGPLSHFKKLCSKWLTKDNGFSLDIGCGNGRNSLYLKDKYGYTCELFDPIGENVSLCKSAGLNATKSKAQDWKYETDKYDVVLYINSAMYLSISEQQDVLKKVIKSLKPNGILFYSVMLNWNNEERNVLEDEEVINICKAKKFKCVDLISYKQDYKQFQFMVFK